MKNLFILLLFSLGFTVYIALLGNVGGAPAGTTGGPGEETCGKSGCHATNPNTGPATINIGLDIDETAYVPGKIHSVTIAIDNPQNAARNGFEIVALNAQNNNIGEWILSGEYTQARSANGRNYMTHSEDGSILTTWKIDWKAPASNVGTITFYAAVNDADDNGGRTGDNIYTTSKRVSAEVTSSVKSIQSITDISVFPNPVQQIINLKIGLTEPTNLSGQLVSLNGQIVGQLFNEQLSNGTHYLSLETPPNLAAGLYLLELRNEQGGVKTLSVLKK